jgi:hypothetical protein
MREVTSKVITFVLCVPALLVLHVEHDGEGEAGKCEYDDGIFHN